MSSTLRQGRDALPVRAAVVAADLRGLREGLSELVAWPEPTGVAVSGVPGAEAEPLRKTAREWVDGGKTMPGEDRTLRVPLPAYPFEKTPYWYEQRRPVGTEPRAIVQEQVMTQPQPSRQPVAEPPAAPANGRVTSPSRDRLRQVIADVLRCEADTILDDQPLREVGVDSLTSISIIESIHEVFSDQVPYSALTDYPMLGELAGYLFPGEATQSAPAQSTAGSSQAPSSGTAPKTGSAGKRGKAILVPFAQGGDGQPSFWVPGAVGFAAAVAGVSKELGPEYPFYSFQARGADGRSMPQMWEEMLEDYLEAIIDVQPEGPYVLGGHSFGGLTAVELARRLSALGETVGHLVLIDTYAPPQEVIDRHRDDYDDAFITYYLANAFVDVENHPDRCIRKEDLGDLPWELQLPALAKLIQERLGGGGRVEDTYAYLRGGHTMSEHSAGLYQQAKLRPYDASDVLFVRALDGFVGRSSELYWPPVDMMAGYDYVTPWRESVSGNFDVIELDEDHLHLISGWAAERVADEVRPRLDAVKRASS